MSIAADAAAVLVAGACAERTRGRPTRATLRLRVLLAAPAFGPAAPAACTNDGPGPRR